MIWRPVLRQDRQYKQKSRNVYVKHKLHYVCTHLERTLRQGEICLVSTAQSEDLKQASFQNIAYSIHTPSAWISYLNTDCPVSDP
jgi:hypothetical protein